MTKKLSLFNPLVLSKLPNAKYVTRMLLGLMLPLIFIAGCKKIDEEPGTTGLCPLVVSTTPVNGAIGVNMNTVLTATFNKVVDSSTVNSVTFTLKNGTTPIAGLVTYSGMTAVFTPSVTLSPNTLYTATITTGVRDKANNALKENYTWSFTTGTNADVTPPTVIFTNPAPNATAIPLTQIISATFSETMNAATISGTTFLLMQGTTTITGTVTYSGTTAYFVPSSPLLANTVYTATITTGAQDLAGNGLVSNYVWSFTTGVTDAIAPTVVSTDPAPNATGVALNKVISATFSEAMNPTTINNTTFLLKQGTTLIPGTVTYSGSTAYFVPTTNLTASTVYTATITTGAKDLAGNALAANYVWSFTTATTLVGTVPLGSIALFGVFGGSAGITNQGLNTVINNGSIGTTAVSTAVTGFHDGTTGDVYTETPLNRGLVTGRIYTAPPFPGTATSFSIAVQGLLDANNAYNSISPANRPGGTDPGSGQLGGLTLAQGVYKSAAGPFLITNGNLTLDGMGNSNAEWIFQAPTSLTVGVAGPTGARSVILINGAQAKNVYWYVGSAATINGAGGGVMVGNIFTSAGLTFSTAGNAAQTVLNGRAVSLNASVTMVNTTINVP